MCLLLFLIILKNHFPILKVTKCYILRLGVINKLKITEIWHHTITFGVNEYIIEKYKSNT